MSSYTNIFGNFNVQPALASYASYTFAANLTLTWPLQFVDTTNVVANVIDLNPTLINLLVIMPDATQVSVGQNIIFFNIGAFPIIIRNGANDPLNPIATIAAGGSVFIYLRNNSTVAGIWGSGPFGQGALAITSINATSASNNLVIGGVPITTVGTITFTLANDLLALSTFGGGTGIAARTAANTWRLRTLTGTANQILLANPQGIAGDPTFSLSPVITGINNLTVGNINLNGNIISTTNANGDLSLNPNGTGKVSIVANAGVPASLIFQNPTNNGYVGLRAGAVAAASTLVWTLPLIDGTAGQILQTNGGGILGWASAVAFTGVSTNNAIAKFNGVGGAIQNSGVIIDVTNNITGANSIVLQNLNIGVIDGNTINISNANGSLNLVPNGAGEVLLFGNTTARAVVGVPSGLFFDDGASVNFVGLVAQTAAMAQFLTSTVPAANASTMSWSTPQQGVVFITTLTAANSATIDFTNAGGTFPVYNSYLIIARNIIPVNNDVNILMQFYIAGAVISAGYNYSFASSDAGGGGLTGANQFGTAAAQFVMNRNLATGGLPNAGTIPNASFNGTFTILNPQSGIFTSMIEKHMMIQASGSYIQAEGGGTLANASAINGVRFLMSAGNISSGTFTLYGMN